jgi:hypothetical protein
MLKWVETGAGEGDDRGEYREAPGAETGRSGGASAWSGEALAAEPCRRPARSTSSRKSICARAVVEAEDVKDSNKFAADIEPGGRRQGMCSPASRESTSWRTSSAGWSLPRKSAAEDEIWHKRRHGAGGRPRGKEFTSRPDSARGAGPLGALGGSGGQKNYQRAGGTDSKRIGPALLPNRSLT